MEGETIEDGLSLKLDHIAKGQGNQFGHKKSVATRDMYIETQSDGPLNYIVVAEVDWIE